MANKNSGTLIRAAKNTLIVLATLAVIGFVFTAVLFVYYAGQIPDPTAIASRRVNESTKIYDRTGNAILYDVHGEEKRTIIPWEQMPDTIKKATLAAEDSEFYNHKGIDFKGILRALYKDISHLSASQGGSTITQQLVKKSLLGDEKTIGRKIKEAVLSIQVERKFSKDQIFWMYLNQIPYGSNAYGIESAAQTYFGKSAKDLSLVESATLAGMPQRPSYYSPYGSHFRNLIDRKNFVLERMRTLNYINEKDYQTAKNITPQFKQPAGNMAAAHFVIMVKEYLVDKYGEDIVDNGGLKVITTLDTNLQKDAEDAVTKYAKINIDKYKANNAAMVAADPKTGQILAMVGSKNYSGAPEPAGCNPGKSCKFEGNFNVATAGRQPGSSFKPFAYAKAFIKGFTDSTILFDLPTEFNPNCDSSATQVVDSTGQQCYNPQNYDGKYRGPVTMRQALDESLNVPSVETLYLAGMDNTIDLAHQMGITTLKDRSRYGLSLVLGGGEVKLTDMVASYGVFANDGIRVPQTFIIKVTTGDGTVLEEYKKDETRVFDPQIARLMSDVLSDNNARGPVFGYNSPLYISDRPVAVKTGTTQQNRDGWIIGYTPSLVAGVWTGNNDNSSMTAAGAGMSAAGPMWNEFMRTALAGTSVEHFITPDPIITDKIMLNGSYHGSEGIHSILYYVDKENPTGSAPSSPYLDPQFKNWEGSVQRWVSATGQANETVPLSPEVSPTPSQSP